MRIATDRKGRARLLMSPGCLDFVISCEGFTEESGVVCLEAGETAEKTVVLKKAVSYPLSVELLTETGLIVPAIVRVRSVDSNEVHRQIVSWSEDERSWRGIAKFEALPPGQYEVEPRSSGFQFEPMTSSACPPADVKFLCLDRNVGAAELVIEVLTEDKRPVPEMSVAYDMGHGLDIMEIDDYRLSLGRVPETADVRWCVRVPGRATVSGRMDSFCGVSGNSGVRIARVTAFQGWGAIILVQDGAGSPIPSAIVRFEGIYQGETNTNGELLVRSDSIPGWIEIERAGIARRFDGMPLEDALGRVVCVY